MGAETGEGVRGVTREELREAVGAVLEASMRVTPSLELAGHRAILRAFLDSGLTDGERETVGKVRRSIEGAFHGGPCRWEKWLAALAPIAEKKNG